MTLSPNTEARTGTSVLSIISFVPAAIAVFLVPILFGGVAIALAGIAVSRRERLGKVALVVAIVATVVGFVLGAVAGAQMSQDA